jgi:hypothetical protein
MNVLQIHFITIEIGIVGGSTSCQRAQSTIRATYTERFRRKAADQLMHTWECQELTRVIHELDTMTHHRHFVQRWLSIEQNVTIVSEFKFTNLLSILQMPLDDPTEL